MLRTPTNLLDYEELRPRTRWWYHFVYSPLAPRNLVIAVVACGVIAVFVYCILGALALAGIV
jgi:hypothetical protein